jgi:hypothetical protein
MFSPSRRGSSSSKQKGQQRGFFRGGENGAGVAEDVLLTSKDVCSIAVIAGRSLHERGNLKTRVRCALLAPGLVDSVAVTDGAYGTDPVFRAEIHLPLTLHVNTYTHLSVELLDEEMTKVVGFGTMDFQAFAIENKGKVPGKWIAMWDDLRENIVGHVCVRVTLEGVNFGKEKARNLVANKNVLDGEKTPEKQSSGGGVFEIGKHQISEGRKQLLNRFSRTPPQFKKPEEVTREAQETVTLKSKELEEEKKRREALEKQLEEMKRAQKEREKRERVTGGVMNPISTGATVSEIAHDFENLNNNFSYNNNNSRETINRTREEEEEEEEERSMDTNARSQRSFLLDTSKVSVGSPLSPVRSSMNTSVANRSFRDEQTNQQQQTKEQALRSLRQRGILTDISMQARERASRNFIRKPIGLVSRIADRSRRTVLKKFTTLRSIVQTIDPNVLVGAAIGLFLVGFRSSRSADERDLRFVSIEDVDVSEQHQKLEQQQQQSGNNIDYFYPDDPRGPLRRGEYEVKPGDSLCAATGCVLPEKVEVRDANGNLVKYPDVIYPGDRITLFH